MEPDELIRKALSELAHRRWEKTTPEQRAENARKMNEARWKAKTKKERSAAAAEAAKARWKRKREKTAAEKNAGGMGRKKR